MSRGKWFDFLSISAFALLLVGTPTQAPGASFTVFDVSELQAALATAATNAEDDTITVEAGTYSIATTLSYAPSGSEDHALTIEGAGAGTTILNGGSTTRVLDINVAGPNADITLRGLSIRNGNAAGMGGGLRANVDAATLTVENAEFTGNSAANNGGGISADSATGALILRGSIIRLNGSGQDGGGAALYTESGTIALSNNILASNTADNVGGAISVSSGTGTQSAMNNTFYGNSAVAGGGISFYSEHGATTLYVYNTILSDSTAQAISQADAGTVEAIYSDIEGGAGQSWYGIGCIDQDPLLTSPATGDFHLGAGSPCIDAGDSNHDPATDFEGDSRWDDPTGGNSGVGPPWVDIGADERFPADPNAPASPVKLIFIHHSTGENWLADDNGGLGLELRDNNYFVSDTNYDWGPDSIGSATDIGNWWTWFRGTSSGTYTAAVYAENGQHSSYTRLDTEPPGSNEIVMFKSCFPNSALQGNAADPVPSIDSNPLKGEGSGSEYHTVANAKGIYVDILEYFRTHQEKLFVVIAAPPLSDSTYAANARAFNQWLMNDWLSGYPYKNVAVFDFYNVLSTNGGNANTNDLGQESGNHHRWWNNAIQHETDGDDDASPNVLEYRSGDDHPSQAGNLKATGEYLPMLNIFYHCWKGTGGCPHTSGSSTPSAAVCAPEPRTGCTAPAKSMVKIRDTGDPAKRQLAWNWIGGTATKTEFGNPATGTTSYALCLYDDGAPKMIPVVAADGNWKETMSGYKYKNSATNADGIFKVLFKAGDANAKIQVKAKGLNLTPPALPLVQATVVTVQMVKNTESGSECWEAVFPFEALANDTTQFRDKVP